MSNNHCHDRYSINVESTAVGEETEIVHDSAMCILVAKCIDEKKDAIIGIGQIDFLSFFLLNLM